MPESKDESAPKRQRKNSKRLPIATAEYPATKALAAQMRQGIAGQWTDNRLLQAQHDDGITYVAINALMTALRSSTIQVNKKRKRVATDSLRSGLVTKALPTPGAHSEDSDWVPHPDEDHDLVRLIARPNPTETMNDILAQAIQQIMLTGSALLWANPDQDGLPKELYVLPTALCIAQPPTPSYPKGWWTVTQYYPSGAFGMLPYPGAGGGVPVDARQVFRIVNTSPLWRWDALSPLTAGAVQLSILEAIDTARFSAMENGLTTDAFILAPGQSQDQLNAWLEQLRQNNAGKRNHRKITALGGDASDQAKFDVKFPNASAKDMDYSGGWDQMTAFALALFGVPKPVSGLETSGSYAQLYASLKQFHTLTLQPWAARIGQWLTHNLANIWGDDLAIQIDVPRINDDEMIERQIDADARNSAITVNEIRALRGRKPFEGGDVIPSVYAQVEQQKAQPQQPGALAPTEPGQPGAEAQTEPGQPGEQPEQEPVSEELPDEQHDSDTQDAITQAALASLGLTDEDEQSSSPANRIAKALNGDGFSHDLPDYIKALPPKPIREPKPNAGDTRKRREGEKWQGPSGHWFTLKNGRVVPAHAPTSDLAPPSTSRPPKPGGDKTKTVGKMPTAMPVAMPVKPKEEEIPTADLVEEPKAKPKPSARATPISPEQVAANLDKLAQKLLKGRPKLRLLLPNGQGHDVTDGKSLREFLDKGGKVQLPPLEDEPAIPLPTPQAQQTAAAAPSWSHAWADKHAERVAAHFGISRERAHRLLKTAIEKVAQHAARTGKKEQFTLRDKRTGKTAKINQTGAPSMPRPENPDGAGSLGPRLTKSSDSHSYACVLLRVPAETAERVRQLASQIPDRDLAEGGREDVPHVTALYGLTDSDPTPVQDIVSTVPPITLAFHNFGVFSSAEHDVLYVRVESSSLRRFNSALRSLPHESPHPNYVPHMTVAYLKPGRGRYWATHLGEFIDTSTVNTCVFSDQNGEAHAMGFAGFTKEAMSSLTETAGGALVDPPAQTGTIPLARPSSLFTKKKRKRRLSQVCKDALDSLATPETDAHPEFLSLVNALTPTKR